MGCLFLTDKGLVTQPARSPSFSLINCQLLVFNAQLMFPWPHFQNGSVPVHTSIWDFWVTIFLCKIFLLPGGGGARL